GHHGQPRHGVRGDCSGFSLNQSEPSERDDRQSDDDENHYRERGDDAASYVPIGHASSSLSADTGMHGRVSDIELDGTVLALCRETLEDLSCVRMCLTDMKQR